MATWHTTTPEEPGLSSLTRFPEGTVMPYGRCVIYSFAGDEQEIVEKSRAGVLPLLKQQPGFVAYGVIVQDGKIFSMSAWDTEADAKAADDKARGWVAENIDAQVVTSMVGDYSWLEFADGRA
jgi:hypothetical protein